MTESFIPPQHLPAWTSLERHAARLGQTRRIVLFERDPARFDTLSFRHDGLLLDLSKQALDLPALATLVELAEQSGLRTGIGELFAGRPLNFTERRAALHMALRGSCPAPDNGAAELSHTHERVREFVAALRAGRLNGATGERVRLVVNLGIGGSDLGPRMAVEALAGPRNRNDPEVRFVANVDPRDLDEALADADPASTLFIVSSKSFSTAETLANAAGARAWLQAALGASVDLGPHFAAVSNATDAAVAFGIPPERVFPLPEWVGGRYSVWSAIGMPLMLAIGEDGFDEFLAGGRSVDEHFRDAPLAHNLPALMGLTGLWNTDFLGIETLALLPYAHGLRSFAAWLQQLEMESNGKRCLRDGSASAVPTSPIVWGGVGTVGQHAFHQLFYQGTRKVALDFLVPVGDDDPRERALVDNALAQAAALMTGRDHDAAFAGLRDKGLAEAEAARLAPHLVCPGDQPGTTLLLPELTPYTLGQLMALYEHKVFVQGWIWGIDSFDQYGVELGKEMARQVAAGGSREQDSSTAGLLAAAASMRKGRAS
ncbi:glucose-6-phosphate isomerase [Aromatoleum sp.]|uniref:glucose-6-phosphate isomerase n=1 Tax=Aromatoleum sp. TaxID=2307007 RepID=UPI002FC87350